MGNEDFRKNQILIYASRYGYVENATEEDFKDREFTLKLLEFSTKELGEGKFDKNLFDSDYCKKAVDAIEIYSKNYLDKLTLELRTSPDDVSAKEIKKKVKMEQEKAFQYIEDMALAKISAETKQEISNRAEVERSKYRD